MENVEITLHILADLLTGRIFRDLRRDEVVPYTLWALRTTAWLWLPLGVALVAFLVARHCL
jgi:hypothetical protein